MAGPYFIRDSPQGENTTPDLTDSLPIDDGTNSEYISLQTLLNRITVLAAKTTHTGADQLAMIDSAASNVAKKITLTNFLASIFTAPTFTGTTILPKTVEIQDTSADHQYVLAVSELAADRTVTLPLLSGNDVWVFADFIQTLTNKTFNLANNTLTGTRAAFNAAMSDGNFLGYTVLSNAQLNPTDATTYYMANPLLIFSASTSSLAAVRPMNFPAAGTITRAYIVVYNNGGTQGSGETSTIYFRLNNTTDTVLTASLTADAASGASKLFSVTGLSIAVAAGDVGETKWVAPTFATNPTNAVIDVQYYVE